MCACEGLHVSGMYQGQRITYGKSVLSIKWVSGINLRSACLAASVFAPSISPALRPLRSKM